MCVCACLCVYIIIYLLYCYLHMHPYILKHPEIKIINHVCDIEVFIYVKSTPWCNWVLRLILVKSLCILLIIDI